MTHYKVIIVDDDPDDRDIMNEALEVNGSRHHLILDSAQEVFTYLQHVAKDEDLPQLIITDFNMPGITGAELLQALKGMKRYQNIEVIVYSTSNYEAHIETCLALGAKEYVTKPAVLSDYYKWAKSIQEEHLRIK